MKSLSKLLWVSTLVVFAAACGGGGGGGSSSVPSQTPTAQTPSTGGSMAREPDREPDPVPHLRFRFDLLFPTDDGIDATEGYLSGLAGQAGFEGPGNLFNYYDGQRWGEWMEHSGFGLTLLRVRGGVAFIDAATDARHSRHTRGGIYGVAFGVANRTNPSNLSGYQLQWSGNAYATHFGSGIAETLHRGTSTVSINQATTDPQVVVDLQFGSTRFTWGHPGFGLPADQDFHSPAPVSLENGEFKVNEPYTTVMTTDLSTGTTTTRQVRSLNYLRGQFFGPNHEEVTGVFQRRFSTDSDPEAWEGAFGAKREEAQ